jgi:hypothetical protein
MRCRPRRRSRIRCRGNRRSGTCYAGFRTHRRRRQGDKNLDQTRSREPPLRNTRRFGLISPINRRNLRRFDHGDSTHGVVAMNASDQSTIRPNVINLMGRIGFPVRRGVKRDAFASGKRRNAAGAPIRPTEGRVLLPRGGVALLCQCGASPGEARLTTGQNNPGQMVPLGRIVL